MNIKAQPSDQHMSDAFKDAEIEDSEDVEIEASEICQSTLSETSQTPQRLSQQLQMIWKIC